MPSTHSAAVPPGQRIYAIGDVHGCVKPLDRLHAMIGEDLAEGRPEQVLLIYLGDYIDRGPDSKGVLDRLTGPGVDGVARMFLKGNHEVMLDTFLAHPDAGEIWCTHGGYEALVSYGIDVLAIERAGGYRALSAALAAAMPEVHESFLSDLKVSYSIGDYFFCHAGVRPRIPLDKQRSDDLMWIRHEFLVSTEDHGKVIVHGHSPRDAPELLPNRINVDTGAYVTGCLTAVVLEGTEQRFLQAR